MYEAISGMQYGVWMEGKIVGGDVEHTWHCWK